MNDVGTSPGTVSVFSFPEEDKVTLRFVTGSDQVSALIRDREGDMSKWVGFTPSHVEVQVKKPDGTLGYLGAHYDGGIAIRDVGYDVAYNTHELLVTLEVPNQNDAAKWLAGKLGSGYDWHAILDFLLPENFHSRGEFICSALCTGFLEHCGVFPYPIALPWHLVSPAGLLFWLSGRTDIRIVTTQVVQGVPPK